MMKLAMIITEVEIRKKVMVSQIFLLPRLVIVLRARKVLIMTALSIKPILKYFLSLSV